MPSQNHSFDIALAQLTFLAIYLYLRVTVACIVELSKRYADRAAHIRQLLSRLKTRSVPRQQSRPDDQRALSPTQSSRHGK